MRRGFTGCGWLAVVAGTAASASGQTIFPENPEPNDLKAQATVAAGMVPGDRLTGRTRGVGFGTGDLSHDTFLVSPAALPPGIYRHQLTVIGASGGVTTSLRGLDQNNLRQIVAGTDVQIASGVIASGSVVSSIWYGFGAQEPVYIRVQGGQFSPTYTIEFSTAPAEITPISPAFTTGQMSFLAEAAATTDAELWVYDSQFRPLAGVTNDDPIAALSSMDRASVTRILPPGTYYLAVGLSNLANHLASPADEATPGDDDVMDLPGALVPRGGATASLFGDLTIMDEVDALTIPNVPLNQTARWYRFDVNSACTAPSIVSAPSSASAAATQSFTFNASAVGSEPLAYQWSFNGQDIPGATGVEYTIASLNAGHAGFYAVRVSNACGQELSAPAALAVVPYEPEILEQPQSVTVCKGASVSFSVMATGHLGGALSYQWRKDGVMIPGAQGPQYQCVAMEDCAYDCVVSEQGLGWAQSHKAAVELFRDPPRIRLNGSETVVVNRPVQTYEELGAVAMDDCDPSVTVVIGGDPVNSAVPGQYVVTYDATDSQGLHAATAYRYVTVADALRPAVSVSVARGLMWPPNHRMQNVGLRVRAGDSCDRNVCDSKVKVRVFSDEPEVAGRCGDSRDAWAFGRLLWLRRERTPQGDGRVYLIVASATDASGNIGFACTTVVVPRDLSPASVAKVRAQAAAICDKASTVFQSATTSRAMVDGLRTAGFKEVGRQRPHSGH